MTPPPSPGTTQPHSAGAARRPPRWLGPALLCLAALCAPILIPLALEADGPANAAAAAAAAALLASLAWTLTMSGGQHHTSGGGAALQWDWRRFEADFAAYAAACHVRDGRHHFDRRDDRW